jgi:ribosome-associated translation inhibitor RaiA
MNYILTSPKTHLPPQAQQYVQAKLNELSRLLPHHRPGHYAYFTLQQEPQRQLLEAALTIPLPHQTITAKASAADLHEVVQLLCDNITQKIHSYRMIPLAQYYTHAQ